MNWVNFIILIFLFVGMDEIIKDLDEQPRCIQNEYNLELIDQNTVLLISNITNREYITTPDSIEYYLDIDNM